MHTLNHVQDVHELQPPKAATRMSGTGKEVSVGLFTRAWAPPATRQPHP
jgi:hypothetical protein